MIEISSDDWESLTALERDTVKNCPATVKLGSPVGVDSDGHPVAHELADPNPISLYCWLDRRLTLEDEALCEVVAENPSKHPERTLEHGRLTPVDRSVLLSIYAWEVSDRLAKKGGGQ